MNYKSDSTSACLLKDSKGNNLVPKLTLRRLFGIKIITSSAIARHANG